MSKELLFNIQRFSIHDGDGIRTTLFFKGCSLHCLWCHNPESQSFEKDLFYDSRRCKGCGLCQSVCEKKSINQTDEKIVIDRKLCNHCGGCVEICPHDALRIIGRSYDIKDLIELVRKDTSLMDESSGGVTLSGGEVMAINSEYLLKLCKGLKEWGIHITVDTCGVAPLDNFMKIMPYVDTFLYDLKTLDQEIFKQYIGQGFDLVLENLKYLNTYHSDVRLRIPLIKGVNTSETSILEIIGFLERNNINPKEIHLLPYHKIGLYKYQALGFKIEDHDFEILGSSEKDEIIKLFLQKAYINVKIGG
jgi:pyruvate formate lyase activating enzyme